MQFIQVYDPGVAQYAYILGCEKTNKAIVIDPQRNISEYLDIAKHKGLEIIAVTETHIHADFLSGTQEFVKSHGIKAYLSSHGEGEGWSYNWINSGDPVSMIQDGDTIHVGDLKLDVVHTPGHTPEHLTFLVTAEGQSEAMGAVTGDFIFTGDLGRPDLLEKAAKLEGEMKKGAESLFKTTQDFKKRPDRLLIWPGHGAGSACGKSLGSMPHSSWGYEKDTSEPLQYNDHDEFIDFITSDQKEPPLYFARMKHMNRDGIPPLGKKDFSELTADELKKIYESRDDLLLIDTRSDREKAMGERVSGTFFTAFPSLSTAVGSMIQDTNKTIVLICDHENAEEAEKRLSNIGYDSVIGFIRPKNFEVFLTSTQNDPIEVTDFKSIRAQIGSGELTIVDVRSDPEYQKQHIEGAIHAPYTRLPEYVDNLPKDRTLYVHCGSGVRASASTSYLKEQGLDVVLINDIFLNAKSCDLSKKICA